MVAPGDPPRVFAPVWLHFDQAGGRTNPKPHVGGTGVSSDSSAVSDVRRRGPAQGPLVDRDEETAAIDDLVDCVVAGQGGVLWIEGAPGLGKSRLLAEGAARARRRGVEVASGRARVDEGAYPFSLALQVFESRLAAADAAARDALLSGAAGLARSLFAGTVVATAPPEDDARLTGSPFALIHGLFWLTVNMANRRPLLLCLDDVQWSDEASARFAAYLAERVEDLPIGLLLGGRPPASDQTGPALAALRRNPDVRHRVLRPLDLDGVKEVIRFTHPEGEDEFCAACVTVTGGNPFHVHEVLREVDAQRIPPIAASSERLRDLGAAAIGRVALFRLVRLGPAARAVAEAVATLGDDTPLRRAATLARLDVAVAAGAADALAAEGILAPGDPFGFVHPLIRASIDKETPPMQRGLAHRRAARLLADEGLAPEQVAAQLLQAPGVGEAWATAALRTAATRARACGAPESAARYLARALDEPPPAQLLSPVLAELGDAEAAGGLPLAVEHLQAAFEGEVDPAGRVRIARSLGRTLAEQGRVSDAAAVFEVAIDQVGVSDPALAHALVGDYLASTAFESHLRQRALQRVDALLCSAPARALPVDHSLLAALALRSAQEPRPVAETVQLAERAWDDGALLREEGADGASWLMVVWALLLAERYAEADRISSQAIDVARRTGSVTAFATASYFHGHSCLRQGRLAEAQADAEQAIGPGGTTVRRYDHAAGVLRALALLERGHIDAAEAAISSDSSQTWMMDVAWKLHVRGRIALARQHPALALDLFLQAGAWLAENLAVDYTVLPWRVDAARAALALGDSHQARALVEPELALAERAGTPIAQAQAWCVLGLAEGGDEGIDLLGRAAKALAATTAVLEHARALTELGAALRRAGRRSEARPPLIEALDVARRAGAGALAERLTEELAAAGGRPRRLAVTGIDALTPSEQRVARLATEHLSNAQIAQALFVTPKTVEYHLRHVYQKLGVGGRTELPPTLLRPAVP